MDEVGDAISITSKNNHLFSLNYFSDKELYVKYIYNIARFYKYISVKERLNYEFMSNGFLKTMLDSLTIDEQLYLYYLLSKNIKLSVIEKLLCLWI